MINRELRVGEKFYSVHRYNFNGSSQIEKVIDGVTWTAKVKNPPIIDLVEQVVVGIHKVANEGDVPSYLDDDITSFFVRTSNIIETHGGETVFVVDINDNSTEPDEWFIDDNDFLTLEEARAAFEEAKNAQS